MTTPCDSGKTAIFAIHTPGPGGAPMNETAACKSHLDEYAHVGMDLAANADDRPQQLEYTVVSNPDDNDTVCTLCRIS